MSQIVTADFAAAYNIVDRKHKPGRARYLKRLAHHRERVAVREQVARGDEPSGMAARHPMTGWDVC